MIRLRIYDVGGPGRRRLASVSLQSPARVLRAITKAQRQAGDRRVLATVSRTKLPRSWARLAFPTIGPDAAA